MTTDRPLSVSNAWSAATNASSTSSSSASMPHTCKLAISIPCYKRPELLDRLLQSIAEQEDKSQVIVYLFDDSLIAANRQMAIKWSRNGLTILYIENSENLGIDANIDKCLRTPEAEYVWPIGEDDRLTRFAIKEVITHIDQNRSDWIFANYYLQEDNRLPTLAIDPQYLRNIHSQQDFISQYLDKAGFIGSSVFRKRSIPSQSYLGLKTYFNHVGLILKTIHDGGKISFIATPCTYNRVGNLAAFSWGNDAINVYTGFLRLVRHFQNTPSRHLEIAPVARLIDDRFNPLRIRRIIRLRAENAISFRDSLLIWRTLGGNPIAVLASVIPSTTARLMVAIHRVVVKSPATPQ